MTFLESTKEIFIQNLNKPMTCSEVWDAGVCNTVSTKGKTPKLSLNSIMRSHSINFESMVLKKDSGKRKNSEIKNSIFEIIETKPFYKYRLVETDEVKNRLDKHLPSKLTTLLTDNGFITIDMLREIFKTNNININI
jgi:hypothetical protein